jgi:hypothetical protein
MKHGLARFTSDLASGDITIEIEWWRQQTGVDATAPAFTHLPGCRHHATVASWDLPVNADIYVDRVPRDGRTTLARLRRLLGTSWPLSSLRNLLDAQPIHAGTGSPAALHSTLAGTPDLRPYLFYVADGDLKPVWTDA